MEAQWVADPTGGHELRYWDGTKWTEHVSDAGVSSTDFLPADTPPPPPPGGPTPPPPPPPLAEEAPLAVDGLAPEEAFAPDIAEPAAAAESPEPAAKGGGGWKDKLKSAAQQAAQQGKQLADQAKTAVAEQQQKRLEQAKNDPNTLWFGESKNPTGISKAFYRVTNDRVWIDSGVLGVKSEHVPLWAVKDIDVRQSMLQRGKDVGDVVLWLEDPTLAADPTGMMSYSGQSAAQVGAQTSGEVLLDNVEGPYALRDLLMPLVSEARQKKMMERQSQFVHHMNPPGYAAAPPPPAPAPAAAPAGGGASDLASQLRELAQLRDDGILSDEEFQAQKTRLLGG